MPGHEQQRERNQPVWNVSILFKWIAISVVLAAFSSLNIHNQIQKAGFSFWKLSLILVLNSS